MDPETREELSLTDAVMDGDEIESGFLRSSTASYPIVRGVARFVNHEDKNYAGSFGYQWNKWKKIQFESANKGRPLEGYTTMMWERILDLENKPHDLNGQLIVDLGCGPGRFVEVARAKGALVIGVDFSLAVEAARENFRQDKDTCIIQADALKLPIKDMVADGVFSIGVLHHTPQPSKGVEQAYRILKPEGWFGISVYSRGGYYQSASVNLWRKIFNFFWPVFRHYPPLFYSYFTVYALRPVVRAIPFLGKFIKVFFPFVNLDDKQWSLLDTFDSVTPSYQSSHESYEVYRWFVDNGYRQIRPTNWSFTAYVGEK